MEDMFKFEMPKNQSSIIKVLGVGGGGSNAVNHMHSEGIMGVDFIVCNTDAQSLDMSSVPNKIALGDKGLGAGSVPMVAEKAANEKSEEIKKLLESNTEMLFITAGMGGGTGTGAAPVIAKIAKEIELEDEEVSKILVVAIVTLPFSFEGRKRKQQAEKGIAELRKYADAVLIISNDKLRQLYGDLGLSEAFRIADNVLLTAARGIAEIITEKAYVNIDFKDVNTVMRNSGVAIMGTGIAEGENRAHTAIEMALKSPLLNDNDIKGTSNILLYLSSGAKEISMDEITEITEYILDEAGNKAEIIWGAGRDDSLGDQISVTIVATGFDKDPVVEKKPEKHDLYKTKEKIDETKNSIGLPRPTRPAPEPRIDDEDSRSEEISLIRKPKAEPEEPKPTVSYSSEERPKVIRFLLDDPVSEEIEPEPNIKVDAIADAAAQIKEVRAPETIEFTVAEPEPEITIERHKKTEDESISEEEQEVLNKRARERVERLRQMSLKLKSPGGLDELETEPAYKRKNVELSNAVPSEDSEVSKYTLSDGDDDGSKLKSDNSFLHDNVD
jgi:cell division protein FtsZ